MKSLLHLIRRLFLRDEGLNIIHDLVIYPGKMEGNQLDPRLPENRPYMIICFNYFEAPEKDERIIQAVERRFRDVPEIEGIKLPTVRETLSTGYQATTTFKERISLS